MKRVGDRRYVAPPPEPLVHPHPDEAVAVAEPVDGADAREAIKPGSFLQSFQKACVVDVEAGWPPDANANARRPDVDPLPNDHGV